MAAGYRFNFNHSRSDPCRSASRLFCTAESSFHTSRPGADRPGADRPGADRPGDDRPGDDRPGDDRPGADRPGADRLGESV